MIRKVLATKKKTVAYGFVGKWNDGSPGWCVPEFIHAGWSRAPEAKYFNNGAPSYFCKITIEQVFRKDGRAIVRKMRVKT
jgi:hypothetical protein